MHFLGKFYCSTRPGRFDQILHVPSPSFEDRIEIVRNLFPKISFSKQKQDCICKETENWSVADLLVLRREVLAEQWSSNTSGEQKDLLENIEKVLKCPCWRPGIEVPKFF